MSQASCSTNSHSALPPELQQFSYLNEREVSALTGLAVQSLRNSRFKKIGFPYVKFGKSVRYKLADVLAAMEGRRIETEAI
jgi:hypothetical protein